MEIKKWNDETRQAYVGTLLYSLLGIAAAILTPFVFVGKLAFLAGSGTGFAGALYSIVEVGIIVGYIIFFLAVKDLRNITEGNEKKAFGRVFLSIIFDIAAAILGVFHVGFICGVLSLVSCLLLISAYSSLKVSRRIGDMSPSAAAGFGLLFTAEILIIVAICLGWIPVIKVISTILKAIAWLLVLIGWKKVAEPVAVSGDEAVAKESVIEVVKDVFKESLEEAKEVAVDARGIVNEVADEIKGVAEEVKDTAEDLKDKMKGD